MGKLKGVEVLEFQDILEPENEQNYILDFNLKVSGESIEIGKFMVKPMQGNNPEKAVKDKEDKGSKENSPGKNTTENVTDINNNKKEAKPEKTEKDNDKRNSDNITSSDNLSNKKNQSQKDKQKDQQK